jgi:hypothetical protein
MTTLRVPAIKAPKLTPISENYFGESSGIALDCNPFFYLDETEFTFNEH